MSYLHIAFDPSARASLRQAFPDDRTLAFWDDLSFGSIDSPDPRRRADSIERDFGFAWQGVADQVAVWDAIETEIGAGATDCIAWYSRRSVVEFANFLAFNEWMGTRPFRAVDLTDVEVPPAHRTPTQADRIPVRAVGCLNAETIQRERLTERTTTPSPEQRAADRLLWDTLRAENAPIRIVRQATLVSAGIDVFDGMLRAFCPPDWRGMAYPAGCVIGAHAEDGIDQARDLILVSRLFALIDAGIIEGRGGFTSVRDTQIRVRPATSGEPPSHALAGDPPRLTDRPITL